MDITQLGAIGILCATLLVMAQAIRPLIKDLIAARRENTDVINRTVTAMSEVSEGLRHLIAIDRQRIEQNEATAAAIGSANITLAKLPELIEQRVTAPESALVHLHQERTDKAVKQVEKTVNEGIERIEATVRDAIEAVQKHQPYAAIMDKLHEIHAAVKLIQSPAAPELPAATPESPTENKGDEA